MKALLRALTLYIFLKKVRTNMLPNDSVIYRNGASVLRSNIINEATIRKFTGLTNSEIFR